MDGRRRVARGVTLLFFATAREAVGTSGLVWSVPPDGADVADVLAAVGRAHPRLIPVLRSSRLVLNGRYLAHGKARVAPGDELAIHPPYSGG